MESAKQMAGIEIGGNTRQSAHRDVIIHVGGGSYSSALRRAVP
jgi:hypothetical protein